MTSSALRLAIHLLAALTVIPPTKLGLVEAAEAKDYYYTRTREHPNHLRVAEEFKNQFVDEIKYESQINGTKYEYYKSTLSLTHDELVFETIDKIFRHRLSPFYVHHYDNDDDKRRSSDPTVVSQEACARDLMYLVDKLPRRSSAGSPASASYEQFNPTEDEMLSPELSAFFDSYARQEAGILTGNIYWVGAYDQCINRHIFELTSSHPSDLKRVRMNDDNMSGPRDQRVVSFKGRYCVASLKAPGWDSMIEAKKVSARNYFKSERQFDNYANLFRLQLGICLPSSCDSSSLERHPDEIKLLAGSTLDHRYADYNLIDLYCLPDETSPLRTWSGSALNFLVFISLWTVILLLATLADVFEFIDTTATAGQTSGGDDKKKTNSVWPLLVSWFSLRANYRKLMKVQAEEEEGKSDASQAPSNERQQQPVGRSSDTRAATTTANSTGVPASNASHLKVNLRFLNAFKVMIMFWIVNGHIMLLMIQTAKNILYSDALLNGLMHFLIGATFGVDLFFTMTGFLTAYLLFNSGHAFKMRPSAWLYLTFHRYWRLAPMYLLTFWFSRSVMQLLGSGPLWDYGTSSLTFRGLCNHESWWYPMTLTSNLHGLFEECMITSWYISCDMQFWLVSPIFIHLLAKSPASGWMASLATIIMSSKLRYESILQTVSARHDELVRPRADIFMRVSHDLPALYTHPHYRISAYIVGMLAGHYVYMVKSGKWSSRLADEYAKNRDQLVMTTETASTNTTITDDSTTPAQLSTKSPEGSAIVKSALAESKKITPTSMTSNKWRDIIAYLGLFLFAVMAFVSYLLSHYYPLSLLKYAKIVSAYAYAVDHLIMSAGASLVIVTMCFGQWKWITDFLSKPFWTRLSKMNYALLLLQCEAIYYQIFRYDQVPVAGTRELVNILFNLLVTLYPLAFVVTLAFEYPLANIEKLLLRR